MYKLINSRILFSFGLFSIFGANLFAMDNVQIKEYILENKKELIAVTNRVLILESENKLLKNMLEVLESQRNKAILPINQRTSKKATEVNNLIEKDSQYIVTAWNANLRYEPSIKSKKARSVTVGESVTVKSSNNVWHKLENGLWINEDVISKSVSLEYIALKNMQFFSRPYYDKEFKKGFVLKGQKFTVVAKTKHGWLITNNGNYLRAFEAKKIKGKL